MLENLPERFEGPSAWVGPDMAKRPELWISELSAADVTELEAAAESYAALNRDIGAITASDFPLPRYSGRLAALREKLLGGIGV